ncbi:MAG: low molecular weight protein-tyrosine-phosphatase [Pseudomonadota bacterium]
MPEKSVLFVCLGNICRSPLAEAAFRKLADEAGLQVEADSAGTGSWHLGDPPDPRAQATARSHGVDISGYQARQVSAGDFTRFTHIIALDHSNLHNLRAVAPQNATAELSLLLDHVDGREGQEVDDPYFGGQSGFERTWSEVVAGAEGLIGRLRTQP